MFRRLRVKYSLFLSDFNETWIFSTYLRKILKHQFSLTSVQRRPSSSMRTDVRTDRVTKQIIAFHSFANGPNTMEYNTWAWIWCTILLGFMLLFTGLFLDALDLVKVVRYKNYEILFSIFSVQRELRKLRIIFQLIYNNNNNNNNNNISAVLLGLNILRRALLWIIPKYLYLLTYWNLVQRSNEQTALK